ncbi:hypothetical protein PENTCL1PPCAC_24460, partial [Pristionchus entomophagus]
KGGAVTSSRSYASTHPINKCLHERCVTVLSGDVYWCLVFLVVNIGIGLQVGHDLQQSEVAFLRDFVEWGTER